VRWGRADVVGLGQDPACKTAGTAGGDGWFIGGGSSGQETSSSLSESLGWLIFGSAS
jgi:hypothetical protein